MWLYLIIAGIILITIVAVNVLGYEKKVIEKAQERKHTAMFYHLIAKMCCASYKGYDPMESEKEALREFINQPSEFDKHPIGSYFKLCDENKSMCASAGQVNVSGSDVLTGLIVFAVFIAFVVLGVLFGQPTY